MEIKKEKFAYVIFFCSNFDRYPKGALRRYVRTFERTPIFLTKKYACTSTDDIFLLKILYIPKICSTFAPAKVNPITRSVKCQ